jgi:hypothetical protein
MNRSVPMRLYHKTGKKRGPCVVSLRIAICSRRGRNGPQTISWHRQNDIYAGHQYDHHQTNIRTEAITASAIPRQADSSPGSPIQAWALRRAWVFVADTVRIGQWLRKISLARLLEPIPRHVESRYPLSIPCDLWKGLSAISTGKDEAGLRKRMSSIVISLFFYSPSPAYLAQHNQAI